MFHYPTFRCIKPGQAAILDIHHPQTLHSPSPTAIGALALNDNVGMYMQLDDQTCIIAHLESTDPAPETPTDYGDDYAALTRAAIEDEAFAFLCHSAGPANPDFVATLVVASSTPCDAAAAMLAGILRWACYAVDDAQALRAAKDVHWREAYGFVVPVPGGRAVPVQFLAYGDPWRAAMIDGVSAEIAMGTDWGEDDDEDDDGEDEGGEGEGQESLMAHVDIDGEGKYTNATGLEELRQGTNRG